MKELCKNPKCGHQKTLHKSSNNTICGYACMKRKFGKYCPCKKFEPQTPQDKNLGKNKQIETGSAEISDFKHNIIDAKILNKETFKEILRDGINKDFNLSTKKIGFWNIKYINFGSLDMECNFCKGNSYGNNFHIERNRHLELVVCKSCLDKLAGETKR